jgi:drug/metabolite transporter (DMT)-like permease
MWLLVVVSLIWAFSPGLIKGRLTGLDSSFIAAARLGLALIVFLPFLRLRGLAVTTALRFVVIGAVQFGLMYLCYNEAFRHLRAYEVVLFTITTPIFVTLLADALDRRFHARALLAALLAVVGAGVITFRVTESRAMLTGLALMQLSNLAFAAGQVFYQRLRKQHSAASDREVFGLLYGGAFAVALAAMLVRGAGVTLTGAQFWTLVYLGVIASGIGFFLWNVGATRVSAATLAVMNNAKIPLGVACSLLFFGETADIPRLLVGGAIMALAVWLADRKSS